MAFLALYGQLCTILKTQSVLSNCDLVLRFVEHGWAPTMSWVTFCRALSYRVLHLDMYGKQHWEIKAFFRVEDMLPFQPQLSNNFISENTDGSSPQQFSSLSALFPEEEEVYWSEKRWMLPFWTILRAKWIVWQVFVLQTEQLEDCKRVDSFKKQLVSRKFPWKLSLILAWIRSQPHWLDTGWKTTG